MIELVTLAQARQYLQMTHNAQDDVIVQCIRSASSSVMTYLKLDEHAYLNSDGTMDLESETLGYYEVPEDIKAATLFYVNILFTDRLGENVSQWEPGYIPTPVKNMLYQYRTPTLA